jgi:transcriptional regulator with XRE-family HTH domain
MNLEPQPLLGYHLRSYNHAMATLAHTRETRPITLTALARLAGCHRQEIGAWLLGDVKPVAPRLFDLAHALGCHWALIPDREDA